MKLTSVGLAGARVSTEPAERLCVMGLGSCLAIVLYDLNRHIAGLVHAMLPTDRRREGNAPKYVNTAVPYLIAAMAKAGAAQEDLRAGVFGGAMLLTHGQSSLLEIGAQNVAAARAAFGEAGLEPSVWDVGGTKGRTVTVAVASGVVTVSVLGEPDRSYTELSCAAEVRR